MNNTSDCFINLCRFCLKSNVASVSLFHHIRSTGNADLFNKFITCLSLSVSEDDELPKKICSDCSKSIDFIFSFWHMSSNSQKRLLIMLENLKETNKVSVMQVQASDIVHNTTNAQDTFINNNDLLEDVSENDIEINEVYFDNLNPCDLIDDEFDTVIINDDESSLLENKIDEVLLSPGSATVKQNSLEDMQISQIVESSNISLREWMSLTKEDTDDMSTETFLDMILVKTDRKIENHGCRQNQKDKGYLKQQGESDVAVLQLQPLEILELYQPLQKEQKHEGRTGAYACSQIEIECKSKKNMMEHAHIKHKNHKCPFCNKTFAHKYSVEKHMYVHTDKRQHQCSQCTFSFKRESDLLNHVKRTHAKTEITTYVCDKCGYTSKSRFTIKIHTLAHDGLFVYTCDECGKGFSSKMDLRTHKNNHIGFKPYQCDVCGNKFTRGTYLKLHRWTVHENPHSFQCAVCGRCFSLKSTMKNHLRKHMGENQNFTCDVCGRNVSSRNALINHQRIHTGDKRFACNICGKAYVTKLQVKRHAYVHTGCKPYKCDVCNKCLATSSSLFKHLQTHWQNRLLYSCNICEKTYMSKYKLRSHIANSHQTGYEK